jgi:AcrR family transcriptional regulator
MDTQAATVTPAARRRPGGRSARVRAAVLASTLELLAAHGFEAITYEAVAEAAGVHKTSIYRWWPTKPGLVLDAMLTRAEAVIEMPDTGRLHADLLVFLREVADNVTSPLGRALLIATARSDRDTPETEAVRRRFWDARFARAAERLARAHERGELPAGIDPMLLVELCVSPLHFRALVSGQPIDDAFLRTMLAALGITPRARRARSRS